MLKIIASTAGYIVALGLIMFLLRNFLLAVVVFALYFLILEYIKKKYA